MSYENQMIFTAKLHVERVQNLKKYEDLSEVEFKVFSQWGDDGIIQYLIHKLPIRNKTFVEFGVQNYRESNTRFLLMNNNWSGLVMDSSPEYIDFIKNDHIYWKYDLIAKEAFITLENINQLISEENIKGEIGLLSIDIDGNDFWVWQAVECIIDSYSKQVSYLQGIPICNLDALNHVKDFPIIVTSFGYEKSMIMSLLQPYSVTQNRIIFIENGLDDYKEKDL